MSRSKWKGPKITSYFLKVKPQAKPKIFFRAGTILPVFFNKIFNVHNGCNFYSVKITNSLIGFCFGEFVLTRKKPPK